MPSETRDDASAAGGEDVPGPSKGTHWNNRFGCDRFRLWQPRVDRSGYSNGNPKPRAEPIFCLIYRSVSRLPPGAPGLTGLADILWVSRVRNGQLGVTGVLYSDGVHFTQCLEGATETVELVFRSIAQDQRHRDVVVVSRYACARRAFADFSMAAVSEDEFRVAFQRLNSQARMAGRTSLEFVPTMAEIVTGRARDLHDDHP